MLFNFSFNMMSHREIDFEREKIHQFTYEFPVSQYSSNAFLSAYDYFYLDVFLNDVFEPMEDYKMTTNFMANFLFYFGFILLGLEVVFVVCRLLASKTLVYKIVRIVVIRTFQVLLLNIYFYSMLQLAYPSVEDAYSIMSYLCSIVVLVGAMGTMLFFQKKLKYLVDY